jgi:hypothetical protein
MMSPLDFWKAKGDVETEALCVRAGTTFAYFKQIAYRHSRPSPDLARRLAKESDGQLNAADMVFQALKQRAPREAA